MVNICIKIDVSKFIAHFIKSLFKILNPQIKFILIKKKKTKNTAVVYFKIGGFPSQYAG